MTTPPPDRPTTPPAAPPTTADTHHPVHDIVGIGIGPFNLSLAALADAVPDLDCLFLDARDTFRWHHGLMLDGARLQVPFLADLVSLVDPTSRWSFLNYLRQHDRLFPFYFAERLHPTRREYDDYCRWVAHSLPTCRFGRTVTAVHRHDSHTFRVEYRPTTGGPVRTCFTRNVVLGIGTAPTVPDTLRPLLGPRVWHAADHLGRRAELDGAADITVLGSGQSGAEIFLDLLRTHGNAEKPTGPATPTLTDDPGRPGTPAHPGAEPTDAPAGPRLRWLTRTRAFAPMEYSKLGLEHFTPDHTRHFHGLPQAVRDRLLPTQWQLYKAASADTLADIHDALYDLGTGGATPRAELLPDTEVTGAHREDDTLAGALVLDCRNGTTGARFQIRTDALVLATGFAAPTPEPLAPIDELIRRDDAGRLRVGLDHRVELRPLTDAGLYVQNAELHTHGVGTPDLGLGAWRAATILHAVTGRRLHRLPARTAFTTFGPPPQARHL
ncbi:lysine N(6)-hydroxylase/L-ornithine N(5)-oxygenase family protein [Allostreptomyces psammosilenae]|uniref:L-lysine N6-monooxygenase MbtG n=1 Tax=Allostreptomyces psammosilenae TaxID=1892865 RepID=A0A852ZYC4_9ACTN|nr:SidA/IucD/PvdA family monooxygenase [Allostreptomyces psammosilenae]NYI03098.1 lysine N6-hydroxylase [Allostreptomyces psammosilenae]